MLLKVKLKDKHVVSLSLVRIVIFSLSVVLIPFKALSQGVITLNDAISLTLQQHPELDVFVHKSNVAKALVQQSNVGSPKTINAQFEDAFGTKNNNGLSGMQTTLSIAWLLEGNIIDSKVKLASSRVNISSIEREEKAIELAAETAQLFITLLSQIESLKLAKIAETQSKMVLEDLMRRSVAGKANAIDALRAKASLSSYQLEVEDLKHEIEATKEALAAQWGGEANFNVKGSLRKIPTLLEIDDVLEKIKSSPKVQELELQQKVLQSEIDLALIEQNPAWQVTTGIRRNEVTNDYSIAAGLSIPIGGKDRNKGLITSLRSKQNQSAAESEALIKSFSTQALILTHKLKHNLHVIDKLSTKSIPLLETASQQAKKAYNLGSYSYTDFYSVQKELLLTQQSLINAYTNIHLTNINLEKLVGTKVSK